MNRICRVLTRGSPPRTIRRSIVKGKNGRFTKMLIWLWNSSDPLLHRVKRVPRAVLGLKRFGSVGHYSVCVIVN